MQHQARKRFGQHFLTDTALVEKMVRAIAPTDDQIVVEIGPGQGALTLPLLDHIQHLQVVELDRDLITELERRISVQRLTIHSADALKFDFAALAKDGKRIRVVGNLPYNISTPLMFHLLHVAEGSCRPPGGRAWHARLGPTVGNDPVLLPQRLSFLCPANGIFAATESRFCGGAADPVSAVTAPR
jgi:phospholipid N-methyltransferase